MIEDRILTRALLERLLEIEGSLAQGASATIQPLVEGMYVPNALSIPGYGGKQIEDHLNLLLDRGYISTGGVIGGPSIGIQFSHLTDAGHRVLKNITYSMQDEEEWISAASAVALLGIGNRLGRRTICKRAHAGLIKARAERLIRHDGRAEDNVDIPAVFWWAEGGEALDQNWTTGDFDTWIDHKIHLEAFGVTFLRSDIERLRLTKTLGQEGQKIMVTAGQKIFIGHGHSLVWRVLQNFLQTRLHLTTDEFNSVSTAGIASSNRLEEMLNNAAFAFLILTAEDEQPDGTLRPRENVVHEAGLFQGKLGFTKAILLLEERCEKFSNAIGLGHIQFPPGNIEATFEQVREVLEREKVIDPLPKPAGDPSPGGKPSERGSRLRYTHPRALKE
jgi:Predicted nucleotide-binding protein containing TIR-like domain